jgi:hypothetical protein
MHHNLNNSLTVYPTAFVTVIVTVTTGASQYGDAAAEDASSPAAVAAVLAAARANRVLSSPQLLASLELVERSLFQNTFLSKFLPSTFS